MTKLNTTYKGFSLGYRVADSLAKEYKPDNHVIVDALHACLNLCANDRLLDAAKAVGINGQPYTAEHVGNFEGHICPHLQQAEAKGYRRSLEAAEALINVLDTKEIYTEYLTWRKAAGK